MCSRHDWFSQLYVGEDACYISVRNDVSKGDFVTQMMNQGLWNIPNLRIKLIDPFPSRFRHTADNGVLGEVGGAVGDGGGVQVEGEGAVGGPPGGPVTLTPSSVLSAAGNHGNRALCGGFIRCGPTDLKGYGLTASSLVSDRGQAVQVHIDDQEVHNVGTCDLIVEDITGGNIPLTANMACIDVDKGRCKPDNVLRMPDAQGTWRDYRIHLLQDTTRIQNGDDVQFVDKNGTKIEGRIRSIRIIDRAAGVHSTMTIGRRDGLPGAISAEGDSGGLVLLSPGDGAASDELPVIGMLIWVYECFDTELTMANRLVDVLQHQFTGGVEFADDRPAS